MDPVLLVRPEFITKYELKFAEQHLPVATSRAACRNRLVIGRYSVLPFYREVEADLRVNGCPLVNSLAQHSWIANFEYYKQLKDVTPESWDDGNIHLCDHRGPFVVKGKMTSKKRQWQTHMLAKTKKQALAIGRELRHDTWIGDQDILYRRYVPLRTFGFGKNGLPYTNEWRFFYLGKQRLSYGYYWSISDCVHLAEMTPEGLALADKVATIASRHKAFYALDIAETEDGRWILVEINEGQMANLCENDPEEFYANLRRTVTSAAG